MMNPLIEIEEIYVRDLGSKYVKITKEKNKKPINKVHSNTSGVTHLQSHFEMYAQDGIVSTKILLERQCFSCPRFVSTILQICTKNCFSYVWPMLSEM